MQYMLYSAAFSFDANLGTSVCSVCVCVFSIYLWLPVDYVASDVNVWASEQVFQHALSNSWRAHDRFELSFLSGLICALWLHVWLHFVGFKPNVKKTDKWLLQLTFPVFLVCVLQKLGSSMQCEEGTEWLLELLMEVQLQQYFLRIRDDLNVTRLSHFDYVKNEDLEKIGMGRPGEKARVCVLH